MMVMIDAIASLRGGPAVSCDPQRMQRGGDAQQEKLREAVVLAAEPVAQEVARRVEEGEEQELFEDGRRHG